IATQQYASVRRDAATRHRRVAIQLTCDAGRMVMTPPLAEWKRSDIAFELPAEQAEALKKIAGERPVRLSGIVRNGKLEIDSFAISETADVTPSSVRAFIAVNAPFVTKHRDPEVSSPHN